MQFQICLQMKLSAHNNSSWETEDQNENKIEDITLSTAIGNKNLIRKPGVSQRFCRMPVKFTWVAKGNDSSSVLKWLSIRPLTSTSNPCFQSSLAEHVALLRRFGELCNALLLVFPFHGWNWGIKSQSVSLGLHSSLKQESPYELQKYNCIKVYFKNCIIFWNMSSLEIWAVMN